MRSFFLHVPNTELAGAFGGSRMTRTNSLKNEALTFEDVAGVAGAELKELRRTSSTRRASAGAEWYLGLEMRSSVKVGV